MAKEKQLQPTTATINVYKREFDSTGTRIQEKGIVITGSNLEECKKHYDEINNEDRS